MIAYTYTNVSMTPSAVPVRLYCSQNDIGMGPASGRTFLINIQNDGNPYYPAAGATVSIEGTKPDGSTFSHQLQNIANAVYLPIFEDMADTEGEVKAQVVVREGNNRTGSQLISLFVQRSAYNDNAGI